MASLGELVWDISADTQDFDSALTHVGSKVRDLAKNIAGIALAAFSTDAVFDSLDRAAEINATSKAVDINTDQLQTLQFAYRSVGFDADALSDGLLTLSESLGEFETEGGTLFGFLEDFDQGLIDVIKSSGGVFGAFDAVITAMRGYGDESKALALAIAAFGDEGGRAALKVSQMDQSMQDFYGQALRANALLSGETIESAAKARRAWANLGAVIGDNATALGVQFAPEIQAIADFLSEKIPAAVNIAKESILQLRGVLTEIASFVAGDLLAPIERLGLRAQVGFADFFGIEGPKVDDARSRLEDLESGGGSELDRAAQTLSEMADDYFDEARNLQDAQERSIMAMEQDSIGGAVGGGGGADLERRLREFLEFDFSRGELSGSASDEELARIFRVLQKESANVGVPENEILDAGVKFLEGLNIADDIKRAFSSAPLELFNAINQLELDNGGLSEDTREQLAQEREERLNRLLESVLNAAELGNAGAFEERLIRLQEELNEKLTPGETPEEDVGKESRESREKMIAELAKLVALQSANNDIIASLGIARAG